MTVKYYGILRYVPHEWCPDCRGDGCLKMVDAVSYDALAAELADIKGELYALSQDDGKVERALESSQARVKELEAALRKYGEHSAQCNRLGVINGDCYCGFAHVLDSLDEGSTAETQGDGGG